VWIPVHAFLRDHLDSYDEIRVFRLLARSGDRSWTAAAVAVELGIDHHAASRALDALCARNLLDIRIGGELVFRYAPGSESLRREAESFLREMDHDPLAAAKVIAEHLRERERSAALRAFTDAFLLRGKKKGDG
jgi:hypothetical protein